MKRKNSKRLCALLSVMLVLELIPVCSFGAEDLTVTLDKTEISVTEGKIHHRPDAAVTVTANYTGDVGVTKMYQWYKCTSDGTTIEKVEDRYAEDFGVTLRIPEELTEGKYFYLCQVQVMKMNTAEVVTSEKSDIVKVTVTDGTPVVILDPYGGTFAEIINNTQPLDVELGDDGKVPADYHNMMTGKEGWKFVGWYTEPDGGERVDLAKEVFTHTTRLYAHYDVVKTVTFDANGGSFGEGVTEYHVNFTGDFFAKDQLPPEPTREGYVFAGWYEVLPDGQEQAPAPWGNDGYEFPSNGMIFYAKWDKAEVPEPNKPEQEPLDESPAAGDDKDVMPWMMVAGLATLVGSAVSFRKKSM